jgi:hypothetical protein
LHTADRCPQRVEATSHVMSKGRVSGVPERWSFVWRSCLSFHILSTAVFCCGMWQEDRARPGRRGVPVVGNVANGARRTAQDATRIARHILNGRRTRFPPWPFLTVPDTGARLSLFPQPASLVPTWIHMLALPAPGGPQALLAHTRPWAPLVRLTSPTHGIDAPGPLQTHRSTFLFPSLNVLPLPRHVQSVRHTLVLTQARQSTLL